MEAYSKVSSFLDLKRLLSSDGGLDKAFKVLMIMKLAKELQNELLPNLEERRAFWKNASYVLDQIILAKANASVQSN